MKLPYIEVKFYPEVKSQSGLSSLRVSCNRALTLNCSTKTKFRIITKKSFLPPVQNFLMALLQTHNYVYDFMHKSINFI